MAIDEALMLNLKPGDAPIFRLYGWSPAAISIGRYQNPNSFLDVEKCKNSGVEIVRRMTGGGMIFHHQELTYSIICHPEDIGSKGNVKEDYQTLCSFLLRFYNVLGLDSSFVNDLASSKQSVKCKGQKSAIVEAKIGERTALCFAGKEKYDIAVGTKDSLLEQTEIRKIGGNAQRRSGRKIFQHGSIPLKKQDEEVKKYISHADIAKTFQADSLDKWMGDLKLQLPDSLTFALEQLQVLLKHSFEYYLGPLFDSELTRNEKELVNQLLHKKYSQDSWNLNGK